MEERLVPVFLPRELVGVVEGNDKMVSGTNDARGGLSNVLSWFREGIPLLIVCVFPMVGDHGCAIVWVSYHSSTC